jgi:ribosomal protein L7/L12
MSPEALTGGAIGVIVAIAVIATFKGMVRARGVPQASAPAGSAADPATWSPELLAAARDPRRKIEAIKRLREATGLGLADAKNAVESFQRSAP